MGFEGQPMLDLEVALAQMGQASSLALVSSMSTLSDVGKQRIMATMVRQRAINEAVYLHVLSMFDQSPGVLPGVSRRVGYAFLTQKMNYSSGAANADLTAAKALDPTGAGFHLPHPGDPTDENGPGGGPDPSEQPDPNGQTEPNGQTDADGQTDPKARCVLDDDGLPLLGAALAAGLVTRSHIDVALRCLGRVPQHLADRVDDHGISGRRKIDAFLTSKSRQHSPTTTGRLAEQLLEELNPGGNDRHDPLAYTRRTLTFTKDSTGMTVVHGLLDPATAAVVEAALQHFRARTSPQPGPAGKDHGHNGPDGEQTALPIRDTRPKGQRNVDALNAMCTAALRAHYPTMADGGPGRQPAAPLAKVVVVATPEQAEAARRTTPPPLDLDGVPMCPHSPPGSGPPGSGPPGSGPPGSGPQYGHCNEGHPPERQRSDGAGLAHEAETGDPLSPRTLGRLLCDAELQTVVLGANRAVLDLGRTTRLATANQRTALVARDRGCAVPGCPMPPSACEAHHVTWWRNGGTTDIDNLALLCSCHHTLIHSDSGWALQMRDGVPYVVAPHWLDPTRTPRRNTVFDAEAEARRLGRAVGRQQRLPFGA